MKKVLSIAIGMVAMLSAFVCADAKVGDVIDTAYNTDIVAYINHYALPSYAVNGQSVIVAEDLRNFGFDVTWNDELRNLHISRNYDVTEPGEMNFVKSGVPASKYTDILETDITVTSEDKRFTSYAMNGYTMIPIEELSNFGEVHWVAEERAIKLWIDGLKIREDKQYIDIVLPMNNSEFIGKIQGLWGHRDGYNWDILEFNGNEIKDYTYCGEMWLIGTVSNVEAVSNSRVKLTVKYKDIEYDGPVSNEIKTIVYDLHSNDGFANNLTVIGDQFNWEYEYIGSNLQEATYVIGW